MTLLLDLTIRSSVVLLAGLAVSALLRGRSAALRHCVLAAAIVAAAAVAPLGRVLPAWDLQVRASATEPPPASGPPLTAAPTVVKEQPPAPRAGALPLLAIVWAAGCGISALALLAGFARVLRIASRAVPVADGRWLRIAEEVSVTYGLRRHVAVLQTDAPDLLATWGLFRPRVLLPSHAREWSDDRVRVVLCHELAHVRRHDWIVQVGAEALRTVYWFNPLLWMACTRLRRESEQACDDQVLDAGVPAREYAAHLLELARNCRGSGPAWVSAIPMARPSTLERRIAAMLNPGLNRGALSRRAVAITAALLLGVALPTAAFRAAQNAPPQLSGSVYDTSGAVLPAVELTLEDDRQVKTQATTDAAGHFEFPSIQPGRYVLEASLMGFRPLRQQIDLRNARDWDRAITLQVGDVRETISVRERRVAGQRPSSPAQDPQPIRVGGNIRAPRKQHDVRPVYPETMRDAGREGVVPIEAIIGRDGSVLTVRVLSAQVHPDFAIAAVDAVRQWRFAPTLLNGVPVEVVMTVSVQFSLE
jgi:TonB family protein